MMNDRFSAELRQHLLATANERPAEGRLAAIIDGVAVTAQRPAPLARLTWFPTRLGPFPSTVVRYGLIALALIIATAAAALFAGGQPQRTPFQGAWTSIDPVDGSTQILVVGAGDRPTVRFEDQLATGPACLQDAVKVFTASGTGEISDDRLDVSFPNGGGCGLLAVGVGPGSYTYDRARDTIVDGQGLTWARVQGGDGPATVAPTTQPSRSPSTSARSSPSSGYSRFTSTINGLSIDYPASWHTRPATEPWTGGELSLYSPAADVIFDPALGDRLYLLLASERYGGRSQDAWRDEVLAWTCPGGIHDFGSWKVDGAHAEHGGPCNSGVIAFTDTRGYLIRLVASSDVPGLADTYDWDWLKSVLETVDLRPEDAPLAAAQPECIDYRDAGTYTQSVDPLTVTATLPAGTENGWWGGSADVFAVGSDTCGYSPAVELEVSGPTILFGDACKWRGTDVDVRSRGEATKTLSHNGLESTAPTDTTLGGYPASRFEIAVPEGFDLTRCDVEELRLWDSGPGRDPMIHPGETVRVYLVDVDGLTLGVTVTYSPGDERLPAKMAELDAILDSLRIEPQ
jgi:hypothetical protein